MIYEYNPNYNKINFCQGFEENTPYYIGCIRNNQVEIVEVTIAQRYNEHHPQTNNINLYTKLNIPQEYYPTFIHKWFGVSKERLEFHDEKIPLEYIKKTKEETLISFFNIMQRRHTDFANVIDKAMNEFADNNPDIYLSEMQNYKGMRQSYPPKLYMDDDYGIQTTSW